MPMHVKVSKRALRGAYGIVAGDPGRISQIAKHFDDPEQLTTYRGFTVWRGTLEGVNVFAAAHGIGSASAAIVFEELAQLGCHTLIRVGTCGSLQPGMQVGDVVVSTACVREDGTTSAYVPPEFPAVASADVVTALRVASSDVVADASSSSSSSSSAELGDTVQLTAVTARPALVGVTHCKGSFYSEVPSYVPDSRAAAERWTVWTRAGVLATEMEGAALFVVGAARRMRVGMVLAVAGVTNTGDGGAGEGEDEDLTKLISTDSAVVEAKAKAIATAVRATRMLILADGGAPPAAASRVVSGDGELTRAASHSTAPEKPDRPQWFGLGLAALVGAIAGGAVAYQMALQRR